MNFQMDRVHWLFRGILYLLGFLGFSRNLFLCECNGLFGALIGLFHCLGM